jgi:hypothetical protein
VTDFQRFTSLLKRRYGVTPADVGVNSRQEYQLSYGGEKPRDVVEQLAEKYELTAIVPAPPVTS